MVYLKWKCPLCNDIVISNSFRHHQMDFCKCGKTGVDLEEYGCRYSTDLFNELKKTIIEYNYNFFDELVVGMANQGFIKLIRIGKQVHLDMNDVFLIRDLEDKLLNDLKCQK